MSTLWTPSGEHPVDRDPAPDPAPTAAAADPDLDEEIAAALPEGMDLDDLSPDERARAEQMVKEMAQARERLVNTPASTIVANHGMGFYELAALHLSSQPPNLTEATVAIDALASLVEGLTGRLGEAEPALREALSQIRMAFVQLKTHRENDPAGDHAD